MTGDHVRRIVVSMTVDTHGFLAWDGGREKVTSVGHDYWIEDDARRRAFEVNRKAWLMDARVLQNPNGDELASIRGRDANHLQNAGSEVRCCPRATFRGARPPAATPSYRHDDPVGQYMLRQPGSPELVLATSAQLHAHGPGGAGSPAGLDQHATNMCLAGLGDRFRARPLETPSGSPMNEVSTASGPRYEAWTWVGPAGIFARENVPDGSTSQGGCDDSRSPRD